MVLDPHAQSIDENREKDSLLKILVLHELFDPFLNTAHDVHVIAAHALDEFFRRRNLRFLVFFVAATGTIVQVGAPLNAIFQCNSAI